MFRLGRSMTFGSVFMPYSGGQCRQEDKRHGLGFIILRLPRQNKGWDSLDRKMCTGVESH